MLKQRLPKGFVVAALLVAVGCVGTGTESEVDDTGRVEIALVVVPTDVQCIQIVATGSRVRQQDFIVVPSQMSVLAMNGLPVGAVTFSGAAYNGPCGGGPATSLPTYVAEPVTAQIGATGVTPLTLNMRRNGQASISVDFETGGMCLPAGAACAAGSTTGCCTGLSCQGDPTGITTCQPNACVPAGGGCGGTALCCTGLVCQGDPTGQTTCQAGGCTPAGGLCSATAPCCGALMCQPGPTGQPSCL